MPIHNQVYVEPDLNQDARTLALIVTASSMQSAIQAVEQVGGQVTSELWLIDAVAATIPAGQLQHLARQPDVRAIVQNKTVNTADWDGWATQARAISGLYDLAEQQAQPAVYLPDGSLVSIARNGQILIVDADGSERVRLDLPGGHFETAAAIGADGAIYLAGDDGLVHALNADGSLRWTFDAQKNLHGGVALGPGDTVHLVNKKGDVYALDPLNGQILWQSTAPGHGKFKSTPAVGPDGIVYVLSKNGDLSALNPDGSLRWTFEANAAGPFLQQPLLGADGTIYIISKSGTLLALQPDGSPRYSFEAGAPLLAPAALAADGSLYLAAQHTLYGLHPDGTPRFAFQPGGAKFRTAPLLSADGLAVYAADRHGALFALDTVDGAVLWQQEADGKIKDAPVLDTEGNVVLGSAGRDLFIVDPDGRAVYHRSLSHKIKQSVGVGPDGRLAVNLGATLLTLGHPDTVWDGRPDVQATDDPEVWDVVYPVSIDVGADVLHANGIDGSGITVAVVDSGVEFDDNVYGVLKKQIRQLFLGQADFVGDGLCEVSGPGVSQENGYCFTNHRASYDPYGHGSHVAGILWNQFSDWATGVTLGIAPGANLLSIRVLGDDGVGTYEDVIEGIQYAVANKDALNVRVLNLSLSAEDSTPYFVDPVNRAAEQAWAAGIVVVAAAGNHGPSAESITVPGNDPYIITAGTVDGDRSAGYWEGDFVPEWSASGPSLDAFIKPDVLAPGVNIVSFMPHTTVLAQQHPEYCETMSLFRMSGTSMSAAVTSGVVALILQAEPALTPNQVKYRLADSAQPAQTNAEELVYNMLQQGMGRVWAPGAAWDEFPADAEANVGMDILSDLAHGWDADGDGEPDESELAFHYAGPVRRILSDDGRAYLYYTVDGDTGDDDFCDDGEACTMIGLGVSWEIDLSWLDTETLQNENLTWAGGRTLWAGGIEWQGGISWAAGRTLWAGGRTIWAGGRTLWAGGRTIWAGGRTIWAGGRTIWAGNTDWAGGVDISTTQISSTTWVGE